MFKALFGIYIALGFASLLHAQQDTETIRQKISELLHYPKDQLNVLRVDLSYFDEKTKEKFGIVIGGYEITGNAGYFSPIRIYVTEIGTPAIEEIEKNASAAAYGNPSNGTFEKRAPEKHILADGSYTYKIGMGGPGGNQEIVYTRIPSRKVDVLLSVVTSADAKNNSLKGTQPSLEDYNKLMDEGGDDLSLKFTELSQITAETVLGYKNVLSSPPNGGSPSPSRLAAGISRITTPPLDSLSSPAPPPQTIDKPAPPQIEQANPGGYVVSLVLLVLVLFSIALFLFMRRRKK